MPALMSQRDRTELRRILKARFAILQQQVATRRVEIEEAIRKQIEDENRDAIREATKHSKTFQVKARKIENDLTKAYQKAREEAKALVTEAKDYQAEQAANGITPVNGLVHDGLANWYPGYGRGEALTVYTEWQPKDMRTRVEKMFRKLGQQAGLHKLDLDMQELQLSEELAIGALSSDDAKEFLGKVPTIDSLISLPSKDELKALETANGNGAVIEGS